MIVGLVVVIGSLLLAESSRNLPVGRANHSRRRARARHTLGIPPRNPRHILRATGHDFSPMLGQCTRRGSNRRPSSSSQRSPSAVIRWLGCGPPAGVLELVDSIGSDPVARKSVWVRFPPPASEGPVYPPERVAEVLHLHRAGLNVSQVSRRTGVSRATVRDWIEGRVPRGRLRTLGRRSCPRCGHDEHVPDALPASYVYLLGVYLGDGCISTHHRGVHRLRIVLDLKYPSIIEEVAAAIQSVVPHNKVSRLERVSNYVDNHEPTYVELGAYSKSWPCLFPQHGRGKKHERRIELADWQSELVRRQPERLLRGLIHSDGCRFINTGRGGWRCPRYAFSNLSDDIRAIFCLGCELMGLHYTTAPRTVYVSRKADVAILDEHIGPKA